MRSRPGHCGCSTAISAPAISAGWRRRCCSSPDRAHLPAARPRHRNRGQHRAGAGGGARGAGSGAAQCGRLSSIRARPCPRLIPALLLGLGAGGGAAAGVGGLPLFGYVAMALLLAGAIAATPWLARSLLKPLDARAVGGPAAELAIRHLRGAPGQAVVALSGIVASTGLMIAMAVMVTSFRGAVDDWLGQILSDDLYVRVEAARSIRRRRRGCGRRPGVAAMAFSRQVPILLDPSEPPMSLIARPIGAAPGAFPLIAGPVPVPAGTIPVWLSEPAARLLDRGDGRPHHPPARPRHRLCGGGHLARLFAAAGGDHDRGARL
jgi:hypothetical protein